MGLLILLSALVARLTWVGLTADWSPPNIGALKATYETSQYCLTGLRAQFSLDHLLPEFVKNCGSGTDFHGNIDDPELYLLAGSTYVRGNAPTSINWELQPLTKYLYGGAIALGLSPLLVQWVMLDILLCFLFLIGKESKLSTPMALIPPTLLAFDGLVYEQLTRPYLDLTQATLIVVALYLFTRAITHRSSFNLFAIVLGLVALSKSFSMGIILGGVGVIAVLTINKKLLSNYLKSLPLALVTYCLGYFSFFLEHGVFNLDFINLHLTILRYYKSYLPEYPWGEIWRVIMTGEWQTWWGNKGLEKVPEWSILWPLGLLSTFVATRYLWKKSPLITSFGLWVIAYLAFASIRLVFPRYLLPVLPIFYLSSAIILSWLSHLFSSTSKVTST